MLAETSVTDPLVAEGRRRGLLDAAVDQVLSEGLTDLSLRPLGAAIGTSARMLVYYFGSKDRLVIDILNEVRQRKHRELLDSASERALGDYWRWACSSEGRRYLRLVYEVYGLSLRDSDRFGSFLSQETAEEIAFIEEMLRAGGVEEASLTALSTYTFAAVRGLELDLLATGDLKRTNDAFDLFEEDLRCRTEAGRRERGGTT